MFSRLKQIASFRKDILYFVRELKTMPKRVQFAELVLEIHVTRCSKNGHCKPQNISFLSLSIILNISWISSGLWLCDS